MITKQNPSIDTLERQLRAGQTCKCSKRATHAVTLVLDSGRYRTDFYCPACGEEANHDHRACSLLDLSRVLGLR
jgi:predicted RNA-binding Zn-ribbon protein involved in translation (DUF1610 family)